MNNDMTGLLNLAYEIEGLLMLHINRGDEAAPEMKQLLISKAEKLLEGLKGASVIPPAPVAPVLKTVVPAETAPVEAPAATPAAMAQEAPVVETKTNEEVAAEEAVAESALEEERGDADMAPTVNDTLGSDVQPTLEERLARERAADISKAFTLNDRFRFRRELFRNSDEEFKETLEVIGTMSNMEEAEDYFYNDLCWDSDKEEVKEFMAVVAKHF